MRQSVRALISEAIERWPSHRRFDARIAQSQLSQSVAGKSKVLLGLALEQYLDEARSREVRATEFAAKFPEIESVLLSRITRFQSTVSNPNRFQNWPVSGEQVGELELKEMLGAGAFSLVYRAIEPSMGSREVAAKLTGEMSREPNIIGNLTHPHIALAYARRQVEHRGLKLTCITMPYCGHETASDVAALIPLLREHPTADSSLGSFSRRDYGSFVCDIISQVADGLDYVHRSGLLHLDIKPSNVLISDEGSARLIDFDGAQPIGSPDRSSLIITRELAAPETLSIANAEDPGPTAALSPSADVYSLAATSRLMLGAANSLSSGSGITATANLLRFSARQRKAINEVLRRGMAASPELRYRTATDFSRALASAIRSRVTAPMWILGTAVAAGIGAASYLDSGVMGESDSPESAMISAVPRSITIRDEQVIEWHNTATEHYKKRDYFLARHYLDLALTRAPESIKTHFVRAVTELEITRRDSKLRPSLENAEFVIESSGNFGFGVPLDCGTLFLFAAERESSADLAAEYELRGRSCYEQALAEGASKVDFLDRLADLPPYPWSQDIIDAAPEARAGNLINFSLNL